MKSFLLTFALSFSLSPGISQVVYWEPQQPWQGGSIAIFYDVVEGTLPDNAGLVYIHLGNNGWTDVHDYAMTYTGNEGWWNFDWTIPTGVTVIDFVFFHDVNGNGVGDGNDDWDNNGGVGIDWHVFVVPAQLWSPVVPNPNDTVTIRVEQEGGGNLWWGVNGWTEPISAYKPPGTTPGDPGLSVETPLRGPDTTGHYFIQVGPFTRGLQPVEVLDFVFHWNDGSWDNNNGMDYHISFDFAAREGDPGISILSHSDGDVIDTMEVIQFETSGSIYTEVWIGSSMGYVSGPRDNHTFTWSTSGIRLGEHIIWFRAQGKNGRVTFKKLTLWKAPEVVHEVVPSGAKLGVTHNDDGTVTFALHAPNKAFVSLLASWRNWDPNALIMKYDDDKAIWWLDQPLTKGTYKYMYLINGERKLGDPYAKDVEWKSGGREDWKVENQECLITVGNTPFKWTDGDWQPPAMEDLIIYELLIRDFSPRRNLPGLIDELGYLTDLGINAVELMPNYEFPGSSSWGYNPAFLFAVESSYGTPDDFKQFVNECHRRGIAVIMDLVFNHCDGTSPYYQLYKQDYVSSPYIHREQNPWGMPDFDHSKEGTRQLVKDVVRFWMEEYHVDGYRYDNTTGFGWRGLDDYGTSVFSYEAWLVNPNSYQIAEHFSSFGDLYNLFSVTKINSHWHDMFHDQMKANLREGAFEGATFGNLLNTAKGIDFQQHGFRQPRNIVNYTESHDEQRVIWESQTNSSIDYELAVEKSKLGATILLTATGVPMIFHGQEFGMATERTLDYSPLDWSKLDTPTGQELHSHYKRVIWLRNNYPALRGSDCNFFFSSPNKVLAYDRSAGSETAVVVANFFRQERTLDIPFPNSGIWYEFIEDSTIEVKNDTLSLTIPGSKALVFVRNKRWMDIVSNQPTVPTEFALYQNYPNPFNAATIIPISLSETGQTAVIIYDLLGRQVKTLLREKKEAGGHLITWDGTDDSGKPVSSGVYVYRLEASTFSRCRKMVVLR